MKYGIIAKLLNERLTIPSVFVRFYLQNMKRSGIMLYLWMLNFLHRGKYAGPHFFEDNKELILRQLCFDEDTLNEAIEDLYDNELIDRESNDPVDLVLKELEQYYEIREEWISLIDRLEEAGREDEDARERLYLSRKYGLELDEKGNFITAEDKASVGAAGLYPVAAAGIYPRASDLVPPFIDQYGQPLPAAFIPAPGYGNYYTPYWEDNRLQAPWLKREAQAPNYQASGPALTPQQEVFSNMRQRFTVEAYEDEFAKCPDTADAEEVINMLIDQYLGGYLTARNNMEFDKWLQVYRFPPKLIFCIFKYSEMQAPQSLMAYCISTARKLDAAGIRDHRAFLEHIRLQDNMFLNKSNPIYKQISQALHKTAPFTVYEERLINKWIRNYGYSFEIIDEALKRTVNLNSPNLAYVDKILSAWYDAGRKNIDEIKEGIKKDEANYQRKRSRRYKSPAKQGESSIGNFSQQEYSDDEYEEMYDESLLNEYYEPEAGEAKSEGGRETKIVERDNKRESKQGSIQEPKQGPIQESKQGPIQAPKQEAKKSEAKREDKREIGLEDLRQAMKEEEKESLRKQGKKVPNEPLSEAEEMRLKEKRFVRDLLINNAEKIAQRLKEGKDK